MKLETQNTYIMKPPLTFAAALANQRQRKAGHCALTILGEKI